MTRIRAGRWVIHPSLDGAEIIVGDTIIATVAEPWRRTARGIYPPAWSQWDEARWRYVVVEHAHKLIGRRRPAWVQYDPGRDQAETVELVADRT